MTKQRERKLKKKGKSMKREGYVREKKERWKE